MESVHQKNSAFSDNEGLQSPSPDKQSKDELTGVKGLPRRYVTKESNDARVLMCLEAPNILVRVEAGLTISSSAAHKSPAGTIYLDGVAQCEPFMDLEKQIYNFDHHEGCLRPFTLSTCEQVLVMILKGLDLRGRDWKVFANDPDLDTILAIWLLLNHVRIHQKDSHGLRLLYALVRLEGIIDAHGLELTDLCAFPAELLKRTKRVIDYLRAEEIDLKKNAIWEENDYLEYTALILQKIDRIVYRSDDFIDFKALKELARVEIGNNRIAVVVEAELGIYELQPYLDRVYGESLGLVILRKAEGIYTLRRLDPFMPRDLNNVYQRLNYIDPDVGNRTNSNKWGGSADIGGSPRGVGTRLSPEEIAQACRDAFQKSGSATHAVRFLYASVIAAVIVGAAAALKSLLFSLSWPAGAAAADMFQKSDFYFFSAALFFSILGLTLFSRGRVRQFGIRLPNGWDWWLLLPVMIMAASAGGVYLPAASLRYLNLTETLIYAAIAIPCASELLFRSLAHGILARGSDIQSCHGRWFFSYPSVAASILYTAFIAFLVLGPDILLGVVALVTIIKFVFAAFAFGLAAGFVRERSQSIFPAILFHSAALIFLLV